MFTVSSCSFALTGSYPQLTKLYVTRLYKPQILAQANSIIKRPSNAFSGSTKTTIMKRVHFSDAKDEDGNPVFPSKKKKPIRTLLPGPDQGTSDFTKRQLHYLESYWFICAPVRTLKDPQR